MIDRMVENGYVNARGGGRRPRSEPLNVNPRVDPPNTIASGFFAEEVRREIAERYGEKKLYEGGLSVRTTLDPKMQAMARKALVDGLVRFDEARGWRGAQQKLDLAGREWGLALADVPALGDVAALAARGRARGRRRAGPRSACSRGATRPARSRASASSARSRADGVRMDPPRPSTQALGAGDVVYVEPLDGKPGQFRLRQVPEISGAIVAMDPHTGPRARDGRRLLASTRASSTARPRRCASRAPSFKPFVYAAALDNGYTPSSVVLDAPIAIDQGAGPGRLDARRTTTASSTGPRTLRFGIEQSQNLMTVRLAKDVGMPLVAEYAAPLRHLRRHAAGAVDGARRRRDDGACA